MTTQSVRRGSASTITWADGRIEVLDQTLLPDEVVTRELRSTDEVIDALRRLVVRGAPLIGACGGLGVVLGLAEEAPASLQQGLDALESVASRIRAARPTAVNLSWAVDRVTKAAAQAITLEELHSLALLEAQRIIEEDQAACRQIGEHGRIELQGKTVLLTVCNAGRLATTGIGTALAPVYAKAEAGDPVKVVACETRPLLQGARLTAWELHEQGIPVLLVTDGAAASVLARGMAEAVVVGADRIAANGDTANKVGTYPVALAAKRASIPFYVAAPSSTFDLLSPDGGSITIEERSPDEVLGFAGIRTAPQGIDAWNPAFDVTPNDLITGFITEEGVLTAPFDDAILHFIQGKCT